MVVSRTCAANKQNGEACRVAPIHDGEFCFWHDPAHAEEAAQARKLGGQRRRRESTLAGAYDVDGLATIPEIRRIVEIVAFDALGLDNSVQRGRLLIAAALAAAKLLEVGEIADRLERVEQAVLPRLKEKHRR